MGKIKDSQDFPGGLILNVLQQEKSEAENILIGNRRAVQGDCIHIRDGFEMSESMSESMSELERARMQVIFSYLNMNKEINSVTAAKLLNVEVKTASRLLRKAEKLSILGGNGKTKNKIYFIE